MPSVWAPCLLIGLSGLFLMRYPMLPASPFTNDLAGDPLRIHPGHEDTHQ